MVFHLDCHAIEAGRMSGVPAKLEAEDCFQRQYRIMG
jgi:hypothetical protein